MALEIVRITDSGCPWAYSAEPALTAIRHLYGDQIDWKLAMIGLAEDSSVYEGKGFTAAMMAAMAPRFSRRWGMPMSGAVKERPLGTWPACRVVVATRVHQPDLEDVVHRTLQVAWFTTTDELDRYPVLLDAISAVPGLDAAEIVAAAEHDDKVSEAFAADMAIARSAAGSPTQLQGKHAMDGDRVRYTAPSLLMTGPDGRTLEAGGFQPFEAYDVIIANADPNLRPTRPDSLIAVLEQSRWPLCAAELTAAITPPLEECDVETIETELIGLAAEGTVERIAAGNGAFYRIQ